MIAVGRLESGFPPCEHTAAAAEQSSTGFRNTIMSSFDAGTTQTSQRWRRPLANLTRLTSPLTTCMLRSRRGGVFLTLAPNSIASLNCICNDTPLRKPLCASGTNTNLAVKGTTVRKTVTV